MELRGIQYRYEADLPTRSGEESLPAHQSAADLTCPQVAQQEPVLELPQREPLEREPLER